MKKLDSPIKPEDDDYVALLMVLLVKDHLQVLKNGAINIGTYREKDRGTFAGTVVPIFSHSHGNEKTILGGMEIVFHLEEFDKAALQIKRSFGIILICFLGLAICAALFASYQFANPLFKLRDGLTAVSKGNLETHLLVNRKDEFGEIMGAFDKMISDLKELIHLEVIINENSCKILVRDCRTANQKLSEITCIKNS